MFSTRWWLTFLAASFVLCASASASEITIEFTGVFSDCQFRAPSDCEPLTGTEFSGRLTFSPTGTDYEPFDNEAQYIPSETNARLTLETVLPEANISNEPASIFVANDFGNSAQPTFEYYDFFSFGSNGGAQWVTLGTGSQTLPVELLSGDGIPTVVQLRAMPLSFLQASFGDRTALAEAMDVRVYYSRPPHQVPAVSDTLRLALFAVLVLVVCGIRITGRASRVRARAPNKSVNRTLDSRLPSLPLRSAPVKRRLPKR